MPADHVPRQRLVGGNRAVCQLANKGVDTDLPVHVLIPVITVLIYAEQSVVGSNIAFQPRIVRAGRMYHDTLRHHHPAAFVAVVIRKNELSALPHALYGRHGRRPR